MSHSNNTNDQEHPWITHFQLKPKDIIPWEQITSPKPSLLAWALQNDVVSQKDYFDWARNFYQTPWLDDSFFLNKKSCPALDEYRQLNLWDRELVPLHFWDGVLFVGCLQPHPGELDSLTTAYQFVLASPKNLLDAWNQQQTSAQQAPSQAPASISANPAESPLALGLLSQDQKELLEKMAEDFSHRMILNTKNQTLQVHHWSEEWQPTGHALVDINTPNIFRIAHRSQKPFHGSIAANDSNDQFFNHWNDSKYLEHITICPILSEDSQTIGLVIGSVKNIENAEMALRKLDHWCHEYSEKLAESTSAA